MKKFTSIFLLLVLSGCFVVPITPEQIALATAVCENNGGVKLISAVNGDDPGKVGCANGAQFYFNTKEIIK